MIKEIALRKLANTYIPMNKTAGYVGRGAVSGALNGAAIGAAGGSLLGPVGTFVGGAAGGLIGAGIGAFGGKLKKGEAAEQANIQANAYKNALNNRNMQNNQVNTNANTTQTNGNQQNRAPINRNTMLTSAAPSGYKPNFNNGMGMSKAAGALDDGIFSPHGEGMLDGERLLAEIRLKKIQSGRGWNPALENYGNKKALVKKFRNNPSLLNKLKLKMFV